MGLEGVELVMEFEDELGISIPDETAGQMVSVGDAVNYIVGILSKQAPLIGVCHTAHSFYLLRGELVRRYGLARDVVKLDARVSSLVPSNSDRDWPHIAAASGLRRSPRCIFTVSYTHLDVYKRQDLANISDQDWSNVEVWINAQYVVYCPSFQKKSDKCLYFTMFYDQNGHHFDTKGGANPVKSLEVYRDGVLYQVTDHVAD